MNTNTTIKNPVTKKIMNEDHILWTLEHKKGKFGSISYARTAKVKKNSPCIVKHTTASGVRFGVNYDNLQAVKDKRESGELPAENCGLKGMEWVKFPYLAKNIKTESLQIAINPTEKSKYNVSWTVNGVPCTYDAIEEYLYSSEKKSDKDKDKVKLDVFRVKLDDVLEIA